MRFSYKGNHTVDDLVLVQVSVPSRESVDEYIEVRDRIEKLSWAILMVNLGL